MLDRFRGQDKKIIVGIQFNKEAANVLKTVESLAVRADITLCLTHASELATAAVDAYPHSAIKDRVFYRTEADAKREDLALLEELSRDLNVKTPRELVCEVGPPATILIAEALKRKASAIFCGVRPWTHKFVPKGLSTILTLMAESPVPVFAIPDNQVFDFTKAMLTIVAADDLSDDSFEAISTACELALNLGRTRLVHLHIHRQTRIEIEETAQRVMESLMMYELEKESRYSPSHIFETLSEQIKQNMDRRLGVLADLVASQKGGSYERVVLHGDVFESFKEAVDDYDPDLIVFGRHRMVHKKPLSIGKIPAYAMLGLNRPILTVGSKSPVGQYQAESDRRRWWLKFM